MELLINKYKVISLGSNCFPKIWMTGNGLSQETYLFDNVAISMWGVYNCVLNDFKTFTDREQLVNLKVLEEGERYIVTHRDYYIRFKHDFKQNYYEEPTAKQTLRLLEKNYKDFEARYLRRIERFKVLLTSKNNIVFMRYEEDQRHRIRYEEYDIYSKGKTELYYLQKFNQLLLKINPELRVLFIFISYTEETGFLEEDRILILHVDLKKYNEILWVNCPREIERILHEHKGRVESVL